MLTEVLLCAALALVVAALLAGIIRKLALRHGLMDVPNQRSSHVVPTPRGGGVGIVIGSTCAMIVLGLLKILPTRELAVFLIGGSAIALLGYLDDRHQLSARIRFAVHIAAAVLAMVCLGGLPPMQIGENLVTFGWGGYVLGVLGIVWSLNFFNFMDGIDGIAASEGIFVTVAGAVIAMLTGPSTALPALALVLGAACGGFLLWNWPPAKLFMGDAGSGYIGYMIAVMALLAGESHPSGMLVWLILGALFFVDATVTLGRRVLRRERVHEAHRSHAYQWLARRWNSHLRVTLLTIGLNLLWLLPCALLAAKYPRWAAWIAVGALVPIIVGAIAAGAGRAEFSNGR